MNSFRNTLLLFTFSCTVVFAQPFNTEVQSENNTALLLGKINKQALSDNDYAKWFQKNYNEYAPDNIVIEQFKDELRSYTITTFLGTWCGDSKREVPRLYKVLEAADFPLERLTTVALDRATHSYKRSPGGEEEGLNIHRVPTIIFFRNGKEVNRITESPVRSLELDIAEIVKGTYIPNYHGVTLVDEVLQNTEKEKFFKKIKKLRPKLEEKLTNLYELNTYSTVLFNSGETDKALMVAQLNTELFPNESYTYSSFASKLSKSGKLKEALNYYEKALKLDPDNSKVKSEIEALKSQL
jgi:tetratricopeptide (TPR) repeat protein